jgi:Tol biopolymer transport system component
MRIRLALSLGLASVVACDAHGYLASLPTDQINCITQFCTIPPGDLVFDSDRSGNHEIWTMRADGGSPRQITNDRAYDNWRPRVAADRRRILFYRTAAGGAGDSTRASLWMVNSDGTGLAEVRPMGRDGWTMQGHAEWAPGGQQIAMYGGVGGGSQIFITDRSGKIVTQVTSRPGYNIDVSWSPDARLLLFSGCSATPCTANDYEIYTVKTNGDSVTRLTTNTRPDYDPSYSPSGLNVAWLEKTADAGNGALGTWGIRSVVLQGGTQRTVIDDSQVNDSFAWSLDGAWLVFRRKEPSVSTRWRIFRIRVDGSSLQELTIGASGNSEYPGP